MTERRSILSSLLLSILPVAVVAALGAFLVDTESAWYLALQKPAINPPQWAFPVAWSIVYLCVIVALYLFFRSNAEVLPVFAGMLILCALLNVAWSAVFFRLHAMIPAAAVLLALLCALIYVFFSLYPRHRISAWLFLPHILWGAFALALNIAFILVNR